MYSLVNFILLISTVTVTFGYKTNCTYEGNTPCTVWMSPKEHAYENFFLTVIGHMTEITLDNLFEVYDEFIDPFDYANELIKKDVDEKSKKGFVRLLKDFPYHENITITLINDTALPEGTFTGAPANKPSSVEPSFESISSSRLPSPTNTPSSTTTSTTSTTTSTTTTTTSTTSTTTSMTSTSSTSKSSTKAIDRNNVIGGRGGFIRPRGGIGYGLMNLMH
uniref:Uncharacterized protein n=1 Tax=Strongyloides stercoralis TaxID=6248 RepID=A0A0K0ERQ1_STRER